MTTPHTPGKLIQSALCGGYLVAVQDSFEVVASVVEYDADGRIPREFKNAEPNLHRLALCWNSHDALTARVTELEAALQLIAEWDHPSHPMFNADSVEKPNVETFAEIARAALAKSEIVK